MKKKGKKSKKDSKDGGSRADTPDDTLRPPQATTFGSDSDTSRPPSARGGATIEEVKDEGD